MGKSHLRMLKILKMKPQGGNTDVYQQANDDGCLFYGLASTLMYFLDAPKAKYIFSLQNEEDIDSE